MVMFRCYTPTGRLRLWLGLYASAVLSSHGGLISVRRGRQVTSILTLLESRWRRRVIRELVSCRVLIIRGVLVGRIVIATVIGERKCRWSILCKLSLELTESGEQWLSEEIEVEMRCRLTDASSKNIVK
jgi:hypothetical protein